MEQTMFDTMLELPLFQGLSHEDLTRILESTRLEFNTLSKGITFVQQDDTCMGLTFVLRGSVKSTTAAADKSWSVEETLAAPLVFGLDVLYGTRRTHHSTLTAASTANVLFMEKQTVSALTRFFEVFRLNVLNLLTTQLARQAQPQWLPPPTDIEGRIAHFMRTHVEYPAGMKQFNISHKMLGLFLGEDSRYVSYALHSMQEKGLLEIGRRTIVVPAIQKLITR